MTHVGPDWLTQGSLATEHSQEKLKSPFFFFFFHFSSLICVAKRTWIIICICFGNSIEPFLKKNMHHLFGQLTNFCKNFNWVFFPIRAPTINTSKFKICTVKYRVIILIWPWPDAFVIPRNCKLAVLDAVVIISLHGCITVSIQRTGKLAFELFPSRKLCKLWVA